LGRIDAADFRGITQQDVLPSHTARPEPI